MTIVSIADESLFPLGHIVASAEVVEDVAADPVLAAHMARALARHAGGDWGDIDAHDQVANNWALRHSGRLLSVFDLPEPIRSNYRADRLWVLTEADRSATTVLWPHNY